MKFDTFVISLDRSIARRNKRLDFLNKVGITSKVFSAIDGSALSLEDLYLVSSSSTVHTKLALGRIFSIDHEISKGEIDCVLSYLKLYQKIIDYEYDYAFILENDAILLKDIHELLNFIEHWNKKWDEIQLSHDFGIRNPFYEKIFYS